MIQSVSALMTMTLHAYVKEHPEVDHFTVVPKEENIIAVLDYLKKEPSK